MATTELRPSLRALGAASVTALARAPGQGLHPLRFYGADGSSAGVTMKRAARALSR